MAAWPEVQGVAMPPEGLEVSLMGHGEFYQRLTQLAESWAGGIHEITPLDDDLASVFGYLVE